MTNGTSATTIQQATTSYQESTVPPPRGGEWIQHPNLEETGNVLGRAFAGTDKVAGEPISAWVCNHLDKSWFTNKERIEASSFFLKMEIMKALRKGTMIVSKEVDDEAVSAMVVIESDPTKHRGLGSKIMAAWEDFQVFWTMAIRHKVPALFTKKEHKEEFSYFQKKVNMLQSNIVQLHHDLGPQELHWYVKLVGVVPDQGGKGYGREILERVNSLADDAGMACYLECGANRRGLYEKVGYRVVATKSLKDPVYPDKREPVDICLMVRQPVTSTN